MKRFDWISANEGWLDNGRKKKSQIIIKYVTNIFKLSIFMQCTIHSLFLSNSHIFITAHWVQLSEIRISRIRNQIFCLQSLKYSSIYIPAQRWIISCLLHAPLPPTLPLYKSEHITDRQALIVRSANDLWLAGTSRLEVRQWVHGEKSYLYNCGGNFIESFCHPYI